MRKTLRKEEKKERKQKVRAREVLTAAEDHEADLRSHGFDPQLLREERYCKIEGLLHVHTTFTLTRDLLIIHVQ